MKKVLLLFCLSLCLWCCKSTGSMYSDGEFDWTSLKADPEYKEETEAIPGVVTFKIIGVAKGKETAIQKAKKNAVATVLFKGVPGSNSDRPLIPKVDAEEKYHAFFNQFF